MYGNATGPQSMSTVDALPCEDWTWSATHDPKEVCSNAMGTQIKEVDITPKLPLEYDVLCKNGGQRHWSPGDDGNSTLFGQSFCDCPEGWGGADCSLCVTDDVCAVPGVNESGSYKCRSTLLPDLNYSHPHQAFQCGCRGTIGEEVCYAFAPGLKHSLRFFVDRDLVDGDVTARST